MGVQKVHAKCVDLLRLACCQFDVAFGDPGANAARAVETIHRLAGDGINFVVFPEAFLTGYCVGTQKGAEELAIEVTAHNGHEITQAAKPLQRIQQACVEAGVHAVVGFAGNNHMDLYNGAALIRDDGVMLRYIKTHLPILGFDRFAMKGHDLPVFETRFGRIGMIICYDLRPPEAARVLALKGADLIVLPTNWPEGAEVSAEYIAKVRAIENRVFLATCNRVGTEGEFTFIGLSKIIDPAGNVLASAGPEEAIIRADLDLSSARNKHIVIRENEYELALFGCRTPELYGQITEQ